MHTHRTSEPGSTPQRDTPALADQPRWRAVRGGAVPGALRSMAHAALVPEPDGRCVLLTPGPRWVLEPHAEETLLTVLDADPGLGAVAAWWRWTDCAGPLSEHPPAPATVRVGGPSGDDLQLVDLLARPMSVGPLMVRATALEPLRALVASPADAVLDCAGTWAIASLLVGSGVRVGSLPRTCAHRLRTLPDDPEMLRPIGLAWLVQHVVSLLPPDALDRDARRELLARWRAAAPVRSTSIPTEGAR